MSSHSDHRFSITVHTDQLVVLQCLRAVADFAQDKGNKRIAWGNTKESDWKANDGRVSFHFTTDAYRQSFLDNAGKVLLTGSWNVVSRSDNDPARPAA